MASSSHPPSLKSPPSISEHELEELQSLLDAVPPPLEALDVSALDGFLCGVLVQPVRVPASRFLPLITDADARALPAGHDARRLHELVLRRYAELDHAIAQRKWFDPWVFELGDDEDEDEDEDDSDTDEGTHAVYPWVAGFATAMALFPALMDQDSPETLEPLALLFRHLDADDLEDADELLEEIASLEPPASLTDAVEELVRATLLLADASRPAATPSRPRAARSGTSARSGPSTRSGPAARGRRR